MDKSPVPEDEGVQRTTSLSGLLHNARLRDIVTGKPVISFTHDTTIGTVLETLSRNRILSGPVFMHQPNAPAECNIKCLLGFVDVLSILDAFLQGICRHMH